MPGTANEELLEALVRHQIHLLRYGSGLRNRVLALLDETEADIRRTIESKWPRVLSGTGGAQEKRLRALLELITETRRLGFDAAYAEWRESLRELVVAEASFHKTSMQTVAPVVLDMVTPTPSMLRAIVSTQPLQGRVLRDWASNLRAADVRRIETHLRQGMIQSEPVPSIVRRLTGMGGATQITRNEATSITRTAVNTYSQAARELLSSENEDLIQGERYVATLDDRTTTICASLDGKIYKVGKGPKPPLHWQCRSARVPVLDGSSLSTRPMKQSTERDLLREFAEREGIRAPGSRDRLPRGTRGRFDAFARRRVRELTGVAPSDLSYSQFFSRQSAAFQNEVLGVTKGRLYRQGGLTLERFTDPRGRTYTLAELARRDADAFRAAGLNPEDFR